MSDDSTLSDTYEDIIANTPESVAFIERDFYDLVDTYNYILQYLRSGPMTVKELQNQIENDPNLPNQTIMTLYRHLNKLEKAEIVKIAGYRKTQGLRTTEKLYVRAGKIYFPEVNENFIQIWEQGQGKRFSKQLFNAIQLAILGHHRDVPDELYEKFFQYYREIYYKHHQGWMAIMKEINNNETFADSMMNEDIEYINTLNNIGGTLIALLRNPIHFKQLQEFFK